MAARGRIRARKGARSQESVAGSAVLRREANGGPHPTLELQRSAGNAAVARLVEKGSAGETHVARNTLTEIATDAWKHVKHLREGDKKEGGEGEEGGEWTEPSEEVTLHSKEALMAAEAAAEHLREIAMKAGDSEGLEKANEAVERFKKGSELLESGEKGFKTLVKAQKLYEDATRLKEAAEKARDADAYKDPHGAAKAFDELFGTVGAFAGDIAPKGPWSGYFDFLKGFEKYNFFAHMGGAFEGEAKRATDASYGDGRPPASGGETATEETKPEAAPVQPEATVALDDVWNDVVAKIELVRRHGTHGESGAIERSKEELRATMRQIAKDRQELAALHFWQDKSAVEDRLYHGYLQASVQVDSLSLSFTIAGAVGPEYDLDPDKRALQQAADAAHR